MQKNMFDFSDFEVNGNKNSNFSKSKRGSYKPSKTSSTQPSVYQNKPQVYRNKSEVYENMNEAQNKSSSKNISLTSDIGAIANAISGVINSVGSIIVSINDVRKEKEITKQVRIQADMMIQQEKQATKRFVVQQKEETKRLKVTLANDYKKSQLSLIKAVKELEHKEREMIRNHNMKLLHFNNILRAMQNEFDTLERVNDLVIMAWENGEVVDAQILDQIREIRKGKMEFIKLIALI